MRKVSSCGVSSESESLESLADSTCRGDAGVTGFDGRLALDMIGTSMSTGSVPHWHYQQTRLEIYEAKMVRMRKKLENARLMEKMRKKGYDDVSRKLWDEKITVEKLRKIVKYLKGKCPCNK
ncbi:hypothetical protein L6452_02089 [Arctium lappa]|uniref:Uncharacterized protein n=1 Tax=Arctium lappa TaxID=4217 RepID=A0ACB9FJD3_ARCLA|nr:hypothetical protein L6452_02089 [Arctium lappa]